MQAAKQSLLYHCRASQKRCMSLSCISKALHRVYGVGNCPKTCPLLYCCRKVQGKRKGIKWKSSMHLHIKPPMFVYMANKRISIPSKAPSYVRPDLPRIQRYRPPTFLNVSSSNTFKMDDQLASEYVGERRLRRKELHLAHGSVPVNIHKTRVCGSAMWRRKMAKEKVGIGLYKEESTLQRMNEGFQRVKVP
jgi:hypothetical protein